MYQFFLNTPDEQVGDLLRYLTFFDHEEIDGASTRDTAEHPQRRAAQTALARAVVALVHGHGEVAKCEEASAALFGEEIAGLSEEMLLAVTEDAPTTACPRAELLGRSHPGRRPRTHGAGHVESKTRRRTIEQGGAYVNNVRQTDAADARHATTSCTTATSCLRKGRRGIHIVQAI